MKIRFRQWDLKKKNENDRCIRYEVNERWILYAESLYQAGMQKILELLNL